MDNKDKNIEYKNIANNTHPEHYKTSITPIEYIEANKLPFCEGNVVKYISRHFNKGKAVDVLKTIEYCKFILKYTYNYTDEEINALIL